MLLSLQTGSSSFGESLEEAVLLSSSALMAFSASASVAGSMRQEEGLDHCLAANSNGL